MYLLLLVNDYQKCITSQGNQDGAIEYIFSKIGTTNKYYIEFGFDGTSFISNHGGNGNGANTYNLYKRHNFTGLLLDGGRENLEINLRKEMVYDYNIVR